VSEISSQRRQGLGGTALVAAPGFSCLPAACTSLREILLEQPHVLGREVNILETLGKYLVGIGEEEAGEGHSGNLEWVWYVLVM